VCRSSTCCPKDHRWLEDAGRCACGLEPEDGGIGADGGAVLRPVNCCPEGFVFSEATQRCECAGDACCPQGYVWVPPGSKPPDGGVDAGAATWREGHCACASDTCCPVDFRFDPIAKDCVCAKTECCPPNHVYEPELAACVCVGDSCCPPGFRRGMDNRCVCINNASCPAGQFCDPVSGGCRCMSNAGCPPGNFCNALGFCQSIASCTSNLDCPAGTFCDITTARCLPAGPCTLDEHCPMNQICSTSQLACRAGCRTDGDCSPKNSCVSGQCRFFCRNNSFCPVEQFCDKATGTCGSRPNRVDCQSCASQLACGAPAVARCLSFVTEGQQASFCGHICLSDDDCPSGYECNGVIFSCRSGGVCEPDNGETMTCTAFQVENEPGDQFFCADSTGLPHQYFKACAPRSGFCPAVAAP
jgi:Cys-rich repeat protein